MHITEGSDEGAEDLKSLKTFGSRRIVPLHSELVRLGFLDYLDGTKRTRHSRVFPSASRNPRGQMMEYEGLEMGYLRRTALECRLDRDKRLRIWHQFAADSIILIR